jgi:hypothetical protein
MTRLDRFIGLGAALAACAMLVIGYPAAQPAPAAPPVTASVAWPRAATATMNTTLADGTTYQPGIFLAAATSVGSAPSRDHRFLRLVVVNSATSVRQLQALPAGVSPWFGSFAANGDTLAWAESTGRGQQLWTINLRDGRPARELTADTGQAVLDGSPYDLVIANSRVYWTAKAPGVTEIRSVALTGGPVDVHPEPGNWTLSTWPWLVNGSGDVLGTTAMRDMTTDRDVPVSGGGDRQTTHCDPTWCVVTSLADGGDRIDVMHPDGTARQVVSSGQVAPGIDDIVALDRYVVVTQVAAYSDLTGTRQVAVFDLGTQRMISISAGALTVAYSDGVLWWSTGTQDSPVWHAIQLPTV